MRFFSALKRYMTCHAIYWQKARTKSKGIGGSDRLKAVCVCQRVNLLNHCIDILSASLYSSDVPRGFGGFNPPPPEIPTFAKAEPNSQFRGIYIRNNLITIRVSFIWKLSGTPDYGAIAPRSPFSLPSVPKWICWTPILKKNYWRKPTWK
jgi:hypothetical protein